MSVPIKSIQNPTCRRKQKAVTEQLTSKKILSVLAEHKKQQDGKRSFSRSFNLLLKQHQLRKIHFHDLRHTHATRLLAQGIFVHVVSARLGHTSIRITLDHSITVMSYHGCRNRLPNCSKKSYNSYQGALRKNIARAPFLLSSNCRQKANKKGPAKCEALNLLVGLTELESVTSSMSTGSTKIIM